MGYTKMIRKAVLAAVWATALLGMAGTCAYGQRHAKKDAAIDESAQPKNVKGGTTFQAAVPYDRAYDAVLNHLKRQGYAIESAGKDTGQIITAMDIKGGYSQTGTRVQVTCIKDSDTQTSIRVAVTEQKRKKLLQTEPWGDPKVNAQSSATVADEIKSAISSAT
jgi:hypothetical protein